MPPALWILFLEYLKVSENTLLCNTKFLSHNNDSSVKYAMPSTPCFRAVQTILEIKQAFELQVSRGCHGTHQLDNLLQYLEPVLPGRTLSINATQMQQENISSSLSAESCGKFILEARSNSSDKNDFARRTFLSTGVIPIKLPRVMLRSWKKDLVD